MNICNQCKKKIAVVNTICNFCAEENLLEFEKCKTNPYYFATKYLKISGNPFTTELSEEEFNKKINILNTKV